MKNIFKFLPLLFLLFVLSCAKDKPLPPYEKTNNIKAKVNGVAWEVCDDSWGFSGPVVTVSYYPQNYLLFAGNYSCNGKFSAIAVKIMNMDKVGDYALGGNTNNYGSFQDYDRPGGGAMNFETDSIHTGHVTITKFDLNAMKMTGKFYFQAASVDTTLVLNITDGIINELTITKY